MDYFDDVEVGPNPSSPNLVMTIAQHDCSAEQKAHEVGVKMGV